MNVRYTRDLTICMDVDDVCANLVEVWIAQYNREYRDDLAFDSVTDWKIQKFVKPECGDKILNYPKNAFLYDYVKPIHGAVEGIEKLRVMGHRIVFVTSPALTPSGIKYQWLENNGFNPTRENYIECIDKSVIRADIMFDDNIHNVSEFIGKACLFTRPWNKKYSYPMRVDNWEHIIMATRIESVL